MVTSVIIKNVDKYYGDFHALHNINLDIKEGEFFTLLGPSGCGKTTLLRMIAGFNDINQGEICFGDKVINSLPPSKRDIGMVFQNYAIFPHLTVEQNVAYGLKARKIAKKEIGERTANAMRLVHIYEQKDKYPQNMSGGQQQRVALARAIVIEPSVLLMDEPLSNLDAKLRVEMRTVIREVQKKLKITTIYVTHDQQEALSISDRIAVMNGGVLEQVDTPHRIYAKPANTFVADFIGVSSMLEVESKGMALQLKNGKPVPISLKMNYNGKGQLAVRPEAVILSQQSEKGISAEVKSTTFLGDFIEYEIKLETGEEIQANQYMVELDHEYLPGSKVCVNFVPSKLNLYDESGKEALL